MRVLSLRSLVMARSFLYTSDLTPFCFRKRPATCERRRKSNWWPPRVRSYATAVQRRQDEGIRQARKYGQKNRAGLRWAKRTEHLVLGHAALSLAALGALGRLGGGERHQRRL